MPTCIATKGWSFSGSQIVVSLSLHEAWHGADVVRASALQSAAIRASNTRVCVAQHFRACCHSRRLHSALGAAVHPHPDCWPYHPTNGETCLRYCNSVLSLQQSQQCYGFTVLHKAIPTSYISKHTGLPRSVSWCLILFLKARVGAAMALTPKPRA